MAKSRNVDVKLARLRAFRREPARPEHVAKLRQALADMSNLVAAEAANVIGTRVLAELAPELVAAFGRFMIEPEETDKRCRAKTAIALALNKIEYDNEDVFLTGIRHVQEPGWDGGEDAAAHLRANSAFGLVRINYRHAVLLLADLLTDRTKTARVAAAQALGESRAPAAIPLLRFKARTGDEEPEVTAECLSALMVAAPQESLHFVKEFLDSPSEPTQQGAALALGESRRPDALDLLIAHWPRARHGASQEATLLAIAMTRLPAGLDFLLDLLSADQSVALAALSALAIHRNNLALRERIAAAVAKKEDAALRKRFEKKFAAPMPGDG